MPRSYGKNTSNNNNQDNMYLPVISTPIVLFPEKKNNLN